MNRIARGHQHRASSWFSAAVLAVLVQANAVSAGISFIGAERIDVAPNPEYMVAGDLTGDGLSDIVVVSPESSEVDVFVASPDTSSRFVAAQKLVFGSTLRSPALGDLSADGQLDLVVVDTKARTIWVLLGHGDGLFAEPYAIDVVGAQYPTSVAIGNFDDAGNPDLAVADARRGRVFILRNDNGAPPCFVPGGEFAVGGRPTQIAAADFDGDGKPDLVALNPRESHVRDVVFALWKGVHDGVAEFQPPRPYTVGEGPNQLVIADFTRDGRPDVATLYSVGGGGLGQLTLLVNEGAGAAFGHTLTALGCPFFSYGEPCRLLALTAGDFDSNGILDVAVAFSDPRRRRSSASSQQDAVEVLAGRGDGQFIYGSVFAIGKAPLSMVTGQIAGDDLLDIVIANARTPSLQALQNRSVAGLLPNGDSCAVDEECLSSRCTNGVCCFTECDPQLNEVCNIPGREGSCASLGEATQCANSSKVCPTDAAFCVGGWCCDQPCEDGRCDYEGLVGVCIPGIPDGQPCSGEDKACASGHCGPNSVCCSEDCPHGFCDAVGLCLDLHPIVEPCDADTECQSGVCDPFDRICCDRRCDTSETCVIGTGTCVPIPDAPQHRPASLMTTSGEPTSNPCAGCPSGTYRSNGICVGDDRDGGCSTAGGGSPANALAAGVLLALFRVGAALWAARGARSAPGG